MEEEEAVMQYIYTNGRKRIEKNEENDVEIFHLVSHPVLCVFSCSRALVFLLGTFHTQDLFDFSWSYVIEYYTRWCSLERKGWKPLKEAMK